MTDDHPPYGVGDTSFRAAGGQEGIFRLVNDFFDRMGSDERFAPIWHMHPDDKEVSRDKLARFLSGWTGGPKLYSEKYGSIKIPVVHQHLPVGEEERDAWLLCMERALDRMAYPADLKAYMLRELFVPAERIRQRVEARERERAVARTSGLTIETESGESR